MIKYIFIILLSMSNISYSNEIDSTNAPIINYGEFLDENLTKEDEYIILQDKINKTKIIVKSIYEEIIKANSINFTCKSHANFAFSIKIISKNINKDDVLKMSNDQIISNNLSNDQRVKIEQIINDIYRWYNLSIEEQMNKTYNFCMNLNGFKKIE